MLPALLGKWPLEGEEVEPAECAQITEATNEMLGSCGLAYIMN